MNEKVRVVVLIEDHLLKESLINKISNNRNYEVIVAFENGIKCLNYLLTNSCDLLVIDLMLSNIDGVGIINQLRKSNSKAFKKLICISDFNSMMFDVLENLPIDYCLRKPFNIDYCMEIISRLFTNDFLHNEGHRNTVLKKEVNSIFLEMGVPRHLKGYNYLVTGIINVYNNNSLLNEITKELYPGIAREYDTSSSKVEQAIRHVIKITWSNGNQEEIQKIFGFRAKQKPCNTEFICKIVDILVSKYQY